MEIPLSLFTPPCSHFPVVKVFKLRPASVNLFEEEGQALTHSISALHYSSGLAVLLINTLSVFSEKVQSWELIPKTEFLSCEFATFKNRNDFT